MSVKHTGEHEIGQIYLPMVNWLLAIGTLSAVLIFGSSDALAGAYGIAVSALMAITTVLAALVARQWGYNLYAVLAVNGAFLVIDLLFFAANSVKLFEGGWFPLALAVLVAFLMLTWRRGEALVEQVRAHMRQPEEELIRLLREKPPIRLPGVAIFLSSSITKVPLPLSRFLRHNRALHERVLLLNVQTTERPRVLDEQRAEVRDLGHGVSRVTLRYGFAEQPNVPSGIGVAVEQGKIEPIDPESACYLIGLDRVIPSEKPTGMARWREVLFALVQRNSEHTATYFGVPAVQVVELGTEIEI